MRALEIISKMGMNMHDHPYLSEGRREMKNEMVDDLPDPKASLQRKMVIRMLDEFWLILLIGESAPPSPV